MARGRRALTLIELLVVIAIVGILLALLIPAVQAAREASRRAHCLNNLKQIGVSIHQYRGSHNVIPPGYISGRLGQQATPWPVYLLAQLDQQVVSSAFNFDLGSSGPIDLGYPGFLANSSVMTVWLSSYLCPSDRVETCRLDDYFGPPFGGVEHTRMNYAANWGNTNWDQKQSGTGSEGRNLPSPFGPGHVTSFARIRDGLSNTVLISEILQGRNYDIRGLVWQAVPGANTYMSVFVPNKFKHIHLQSVEADFLPDQYACLSEPELGLPCTSASPIEEGLCFSGSRSSHPGGVNVLFGDGSVRFLKSSTNQQVWVALNSISSGEVISADDLK
jgi:prepilin-type N-terminal cleavage/methylation domain-containing protein/prepilin-type processing-associated H-X9-DG protein